MNKGIAKSALLAGLAFGGTMPLYMPRYRSRIMNFDHCNNPKCKTIHETGKAYCSPECCKEHRADLKAERLAESKK